jgi:hypothetical protein
MTFVLHVAYIRHMNYEYQQIKDHDQEECCSSSHILSRTLSNMSLEKKFEKKERQTKIKKKFATDIKEIKEKTEQNKG